MAWPELHGLAAESGPVTLDDSSSCLPVFAPQQVESKAAGQPCSAVLAFVGGPLCAISCAPQPEGDTQYLAVRPSSCRACACNHARSCLHSPGPVTALLPQDHTRMHSSPARTHFYSHALIREHACMQVAARPADVQRLAGKGPTSASLLQLWAFSSAQSSAQLAALYSLSQGLVHCCSWCPDPSAALLAPPSEGSRSRHAQSYHATAGWLLTDVLLMTLHSLGCLDNTKEVQQLQVWPRYHVAQRMLMCS